MSTVEEKAAQLVAFLGFYGEVSEAELKLWAKALAPFDCAWDDAFAVWLRNSPVKPIPKDICAILQDAMMHGPMSEIAADISARSGVSLVQIQGSTRIREVVLPRQELMCALRDAGYSYPAIGRFLKRDHTTIMGGVTAYRARTGASHATSH